MVKYNDDRGVTFYKIDNNSPEKPSKPGGVNNKPPKAIVGTPYQYSSSATDLEGHYLYYWFDWGDGSKIPDKGIGPYTSGETAVAEHIWTQPGTYEIRVKAKDAYVSISEWSEPYIVMPVKLIPLSQ